MIEIESLDDFDRAVARARDERAIDVRAGRSRTST